MHRIHGKCHLTQSAITYASSGMHKHLLKVHILSSFCVCAFVPQWLTLEKQENDGYSEGVAIFDSELNCC